MQGLECSRESSYTSLTRKVFPVLADEGVGCRAAIAYRSRTKGLPFWGLGCRVSGLCCEVLIGHLHSRTRNFLALLGGVRLLLVV